MGGRGGDLAVKSFTREPEADFSSFGHVSTVTTTPGQRCRRRVQTCFGLVFLVTSIRFVSPRFTLNSRFWPGLPRYFNQVCVTTIHFPLSLVVFRSLRRIFKRISG
ncbi:hypothetical protein RRG08_067405 [Elysia crispata]|uniref:Transmembrane protein n=1 Tax=Elysia crispata TaxID=231223 RepID=A0AAE0Y907_9GAST|nr:hypothetical protein RRG08_067405 [Elysia crispata]